VRGVRINVHDKRADVVVKERYKKNISVVNYISTKGKMKRGKMNVNISHNFWGVQLNGMRSSERELDRVIRSHN